MQPARRDFAWRIMAAMGMVALGGLLLACVVLARQVLLLTFASLLLAVVLRGLSDWLASRGRLSPRLAYTAVVLALVVLATVGTWRLAPSVVVQLEELQARLPAVVEQVQQALSQSAPGRVLLRQWERLQGVPGNALEQVVDLASVSMKGLVYLVFFAVTGLYLGAAPGLYVAGLVRLVPVSRRARAREVLHSLGHALRRYLLGRLVSMLAVGLATGLMLWMMDVPLAVLLGLVAGLLTFIPYTGPIAAGVPIGLVALVEGPAQALVVLALYTVIQCVEGFLITPLVQHRAVLLAPALTLFAQLVLGLLAGPLGVVLSVPLAAIVLALVRELYVEGFLEARGRHQSER